MVEVIVEYDYIAKEPDELTVRKGDIIKDVVKKQGGWWEGVIKDKRGMFPDNFVRILDKDAAVVLRNKKDVSRIRQCRVVFSYNQDHEDELNLNVGDVISIIGEEEEGWWRGVLNGKEGVFPSNFVEEIVVQPSSHPKPTNREDINSLAGETDLRVPKLPTKPTKQLCEVRFPYKAQNEDELNLKEGDIISLLSKDSQDPGWWRGELNGKIGVFPDNFVTLIASLDDRTSYKEENKGVNKETGAIKPSSVALQRKSLEAKSDKHNGDPNNTIIINKTPPLPPGKKPLIPIKKSPSGSGVGIFSEIKKKLVDVVDGASGSKNASSKSDIKDDIKDNSDSAFDQIERRPLLTDVRATRAKAPGRRLPTALHKDEENAVLNGNAEHLVIEPDLPSSNTSSVSESDSSEKRPIREWEKHKAPWLEEMKLNQAKRTSTSPGPENKLKLTPSVDTNAEMDESHSDRLAGKEIDMSKSMPPMDLTKSLSPVSGIKPKAPNELDKSPSLRVKPSSPISSIISTNRQSLPVTIKDRSPVNVASSTATTTVIKDGPSIKPPKVPQTLSTTTTKNPVTQKTAIEKNDAVESSHETPPDVSQKQYRQLLERLQKLELIVENQRQAIEELRNKLQIETDMRMMLQEKVLQKL